MNQQGLLRMNALFEKMLSGIASNSEQKELKQLYQEYINFGREHNRLKEAGGEQWHQGSIHH